MKNTAKRVFFGFVSFLLAMTCFVGCGGRDGGATENPPSSSTLGGSTPPYNNEGSEEKKIDGYLEDYSTAVSCVNISSGISFKTEAKSTWYADYTDKNGVKKSGVCSASMYSNNQCIVIRFNKTAEELQEIYDELDFITVRMLVKHGTFKTAIVRFAGTSYTVDTNEWVEMTVTKTRLGSAILQSALDNGVSIKEQFANNFCSSGWGSEPRIMGGAIAESKIDMDVYIDSVAYTLKDKANS